MKSCNISHEEHDIYAFHSFSNDQLCRDNTRNRYKTYFIHNVTSLMFMTHIPIIWRMNKLLITSWNLSYQRLNVVQTEFGQNVSFEMRTFRFITAGSSATELQNQTIACNLHLEPVDDVTSTQPDDCSCHTEADCLDQGFSISSLFYLCFWTTF